MKTFTRATLKAAITAAILCLSSVISLAQFPFNLDGGANKAVQCLGVARDASSNAYITGGFQGTVNFNPSGTANLTSAGGTYNIYVAKYDVAGAYQWAFGMGSSTGNDVAYHIAVDANGNVYITGTFSKTMNFNPAGTANLTSVGGADCFVASYTSAGAYRWAFDIGSSGTEIGYSLATDDAGNVFVTGKFSGAINFDPLEGTHIPSSILTPSSLFDCFVAKYSSAGVYQWAFHIGDTLGVASFGSAITTDAADNVLITGMFSGKPNFNPSTTPGDTAYLKASGPNLDYFVAKYDASGNYKWAFNFNSANGPASYFQGIATDANNNVLITGGFHRGADFKGTSGTSQTLYGVGDTGTNNSIYIAKYDSSGAYQWALSIGNKDSTSGGGSITADASGNVYVTGNFMSTVNFNPSGTANVSAVLLEDIFVASYTSAGAYRWAFDIGSTGDNEYGMDITADAYNDVLVVGQFTGKADFDPSADTLYFTPIGKTDGFVAKYTAAGTLFKGCSANVGTNQSICQGVNTSSVIGASAVSGVTYSWSPSTGLNSATASQPIASPTVTTTYTLTETTTGICQATDSVVVFVSTPPSTPIIAPSGPTTFCVGGSVTLQTGSGYATYLWSNSTTGQSITINTQGNYSVMVTNSSGCSATSSITNVTVNLLPVANAGTDKIVCPGWSTAIGVSAVGVDTYSWSPTTGLNSGTVSQPTANPTVTTTYTLTVTTTGSCTAAASVVVDVSTAPSTPVISASGPTTFCSGGSVTLNSDSSYSAYSWSNGASTKSIIVTTQDSYSITVTNGTGCSAASFAIDVTVTTPAKPVISQSADTLFCSITANGYQWYRNDTLISNATNKYYVVSQHGSYTVTITESGCPSTSLSYSYIGTGINSVTLINGLLTIYPSPASSYFVAESKTAALKFVAMYDILGRRVLSVDIRDVSVNADTKKATINIEALPSGVYLVQLETDSSVSTLKLVKE